MPCPAARSHGRDPIRGAGPGPRDGAQVRDPRAAQGQGTRGAFWPCGCCRARRSGVISQRPRSHGSTATPVLLGNRQARRAAAVHHASRHRTPGLPTAAVPRARRRHLRFVFIISNFLTAPLCLPARPSALTILPTACHRPLAAFGSDGLRAPHPHEPTSRAPRRQASVPAPAAWFCPPHRCRSEPTCPVGSRNAELNAGLPPAVRSLAGRS